MTQAVEWEELPPKWEPHRSTIERPSADAEQVMLRMGRVPYWVNFDHTKEDNTNYDDREIDVTRHTWVPVANTKYRKRVRTTAEGNVWSSQAYIKSDWHLPVIDVDAVTEDTKKAIVDAFNVVAGCEVPHEWVPSTHEGHYHLYVNHLFHWADYTELLKWLSARQYIEFGYVGASLARGATFVRFPWIKKHIDVPGAGWDETVDGPDF